MKIIPCKFCKAKPNMERVSQSFGKLKEWTNTENELDTIFKYTITCDDCILKKPNFSEAPTFLETINKWNKENSDE